MGILERIKEIEDEIKRTQYNKATEKHIGILKAKLAKLRRSLISSKKGGGYGFSVSKSGDATVALIGFPSVGKSTLLSKITQAETKAASYAFTTLSVVPGMLLYKKARIQILDLPGIIEGASYGKGRGKEVISVARNADLLLILLDPFNAEKHFNTIMRELKGMAIRPNGSRPEIYIEKKHRGGIALFYSKHLNVDEELVKSILNEYGIHNANVIIREEVTSEKLIDVLENNRVYIPYIVVINKIDMCNEELLSNLKSRFKDAIFISAEKDIGIEKLKEAIFTNLNFIRVYTKPLGGKPDLDEPMMLRKGATVKEVCLKLHRDLLKNFKYALVWGKSAKFPGQRVGLDHKLEDGDIITIVAR